MKTKQKKELQLTVENIPILRLLRTAESFISFNKLLHISFSHLKLQILIVSYNIYIYNYTLHVYCFLSIPMLHVFMHKIWMSIISSKIFSSIHSYLRRSSIANIKPKNETFTCNIRVDILLVTFRDIKNPQSLRWYRHYERIILT